MLLDVDIRDPLFYYLESVYGKIRVLEEKVIGRVRADFFMITENAFYGIEIKSDADTYARLKGQVREYDKYYDYNIAAVGASHLKHIHEHIPKYWGIIAIEEAEGRPVFSLVRQPQKNHKVKLVNKLGFLWRPELMQIQAMNDMPRYKEKSKAFVIKAIADRTQYPLDKKGHIDEAELMYQVCDVLFERDYTLIAETMTRYKLENKKKVKKTKK
ncbi:MAG: sce7726 family protein [Selenomonadaceae bacterium]|nr:sce7726 family protein [Selenomonadaceae bacterium]